MIVLPTASELRLLEILWQLGEGTIDDIVHTSGENPAPNYKTIQTFLRIMEGKKLVAHRIHGRAFVFRPLVRREQVNRLSIRQLLRRHFGGSRSELLVNMLEAERIDIGELEELEAMIRKYRKSRQLSNARQGRK